MGWCQGGGVQGSVRFCLVLFLQLQELLLACLNAVTLEHIEGQALPETGSPAGRRSPHDKRGWPSVGAATSTRCNSSRWIWCSGLVSLVVGI